MITNTISIKTISKQFEKNTKKIPNAAVAETAWATGVFGSSASSSSAPTTATGFRGTPTSVPLPPTVLLSENVETVEIATLLSKRRDITASVKMTPLSNCPSLNLYGVFDRSSSFTV